MYHRRHIHCASFYLIFALGVIGKFTNNSHVAEAFTSTRVVRLRSSCPPSMFQQSAGFPAATVLSRIPHNHGVKSATVLQLSNNNEEEEYDPRDNFGRSIRGFQSSALKTTIDVGDTVVCKRSLPNMGIYADASYEVTSIYTQSFDEEMQQIVKEQRNSLDNDDDGSAAATQNQVYMTLFSPRYHSEGGPVVVTPEEVGLATVREEIGNALWLAVPGLFWVFLVASFYNTYHERTGGSFADAFWGR